MAKSARPSGNGRPLVKPTKKSADFKAYVNYSLTFKDKEEIASNPVSPNDLANRLAVWSEAGYRCTFGWDTVSECYFFSLFDTRADEPTGGYILNARHTDLCRCVGIVAHLHEKAFPEGWPLMAQAASDLDW